MRYLIFAFFCLFSFYSFAQGMCGNKPQLGNCGEPLCDEENASIQVAAYARGVEGGISSIITVDWNDGIFDKVAICNNGLFPGCPPGFHPVSGKYGANFGCGEDEPCPNGLERDYFGSCVVRKTLDERMNDCANVAAYGGGKSVFRQDLQTGSSSCLVGAAPDFSSAPAPQCLQQDGTACYGNPVDVAGHEGWQCGTFNGVATCVASAASGALGVGKTPLGTTTTSGQVRVIQDVSDDGTNTTTTTTTTTPKTESTRSYAGGGSVASNERLDEGSGRAPLFQCADGRLAANSASCDSIKTCAAGQYLAYGTCLNIPTKVSDVTKTDTTVETVVRDKATGQIVSSTSTTSSKVTTGSGGSGTGGSSGQGQNEESTDYGPAPTIEPTSRAHSFYESVYPDGISGVWDSAQSEFSSTAMFSTVDQFKTNFGAGQEPTFNMCFNMGPVGNYGCRDFSIDSRIWAFIRICLIASAAFLCRALIFGG